MHIVEKIISIFAPHLCLGCGVEENTLVCEACVESLIHVPSRCYRCNAVTDQYATCRHCAPNTPLKHVAVYTFHNGLAKELVHRMKYERAQAGIHEVAALMAERRFELPDDITLTHVPTASSRVRMRGYDHALLLTRFLSVKSNVASNTYLTRVGQAHQVGANRSVRLRQLKHAFRVVRSSDIRGKHVVLVDDVLTTGATLESAARVLKKAGARHVSAIVFAQA